MEPDVVAVRPGYRGDIQGLRAIAILLVVICHAGVALPGGFIGVDVFFVISGYVIGAMLLRELDRNGTVSFGGFYARRARRLLPSLAVLLVVGVLVGILVLPVWGQEIPFRTAGAAALFFSNVYLYRHLGYFEAASDGTNPFLHLWSLSVEEQFYLVLPLLVWGAWKLAGHRARGASRRAVAAVIGAVTVASFALSWAVIHGHSPISSQATVRMAFYGAPTRLWELGAGVLLALGPRLVARIPARLGTAIGVLGAGAIAASAVRLDPLDPFPGPAAIPAVAGTLALIIAGDRSGAFHHGLSWRPLAWVGDRSYGWYLWHWPMIVYASILWPGSRGAIVAAAALSLLVAAGAYAAFEDRIRRDRRIRGGRAAALAVGCVAVPLLVVWGALAGITRGWGVEEPPDWSDVPVLRYAGCLLVNRDLANTWPEESCTLAPPDGPGRGTVLVLGDDEAVGVSSAVAAAAADRGYEVKLWARTGCPFTGAAPAGYPRCREWQDAALAEVDRLDPDLVVVANRASAYTVDVDGRVGSNAGRITTVEGRRTGGDGAAVAAWGDALGVMLDRLDDRGVPVLVIGGIPGYRDRFPVVSVLRPTADPPERSRADVDEEQGPVVAVEEDAVAAADDAAYLDPVPLLCGTDACTPYEGGRWRYWSAFELTTHGSEVLEPSVAQAMDQLLPER